MAQDPEERDIANWNSSTNPILITQDQSSTLLQSLRDSSTYNLPITEQDHPFYGQSSQLKSPCNPIQPHEIQWRRNYAKGCEELEMEQFNSDCNPNNPNAILNPPTILCNPGRTFSGRIIGTRNSMAQQWFKTILVQSSEPKFNPQSYCNPDAIARHTANQLENQTMADHPCYPCRSQVHASWNHTEKKLSRGIFSQS